MRLRIGLGVVLAGMVLSGAAVAAPCALQSGAPPARIAPEGTETGPSPSALGHFTCAHTPHHGKRDYLRLRNVAGRPITVTDEGQRYFVEIPAGQERMVFLPAQRLWCLSGMVPARAFVDCRGALEVAAEGPVPITLRPQEHHGAHH
ncbi:MAG TPA: hypothetical protein VED40_11435 [Azospirillaceae bacterium]|nr:hypothetical protein [Azospirillaceae bacterium]